MAIDGARFEAVAKLQYEWRGYALHGAAFEHPDTFERTSRIHRSIGGIAKDTIALIIQDEAMKIDGAAQAISEHWVPIRIAGSLQARVTPVFQQLLEIAEIAKRDGEVEVRMMPGLFSEQDINPPASVDPERKFGPPEEAAKAYDFIGFHTRR